ncbi:hypothetical protein CDD82_4684 [Ophiocordyceps australis]|uniref:Chitin-binding type-2 domain-containing protein n=1 Tax=Ophiocordyceps australis TaxID=1399860 RepID=A0A2C5ZSJ4_9HYPO|nr:hypothetical protein CDD82_4684 [Ophiocordyceps australis]
MKFTLALIASLASVALATPGYSGCKPGTYQCATKNGKQGWEVCDTSRNWEWGGYCEHGTSCWFDWQNGSPYCK